MFMSKADGFRTLQVVRDLRILAAHASVDARAGIIAKIPHGRIAPDVAQVSLEALAEGRALEPEVHSDLMSAVRLAAALPGEDFPTFTLATFLVLQETLLGRSPVSEIEHHWPTFREHYRVAAAVDRAAIAQALRRISLLQDMPYSMPQSSADRTTASAAALKPLLQARLPRGLAPPAATDAEAVAGVLIAGLSSPEAAGDAAKLWAEHGPEFLHSMPEAILAGFRHIYEIWDGFSPDGAPHIPLLDPPPGVEWPH